MGVVIVEGVEAVLGVNLVRPIVTDGTLLRVVQERRALPKLLWG